jgi:glycerol uptake facilitator-like aquaporin
VTSPLRATAGEFVGSALLATVVVGSGIAAQQLSTDTGLQLLENALVTALGLTVLILVFAPVSGAHFNPVVTAVDALLGARPWADLARYLPAQVAGCIAGSILANAMFGMPAVSWSTTDRVTGPHLLAEVVATAGLVLVIFALVRTGRGALAAPAVGTYIGAAYFFTSSTSFANPAITVGRMFSDTFAGIAPASAPAYIAAQLVGGIVGWLAVRAFFPTAAEPRGT